MTATASLYDRLSALADPIRSRLLLAVERQELTVSELRSALQLPQSTVSRHLKVLADEGWITGRATGTSNWYRMAIRELDPSARRLWLAVREQVAETAAARRDLERVRALVAARHTRSQEFFATSAGQWDRLRAELFGPGLEWTALAGLLDPDAVVADLGCGTGQLSAALAPLVARVIAVDESAAMLKAAEQRLRDRPNAEVRAGALESLPIEPATADLAFLVLVLHHVAEPARGIEEAARILRPGGRLVIVDMLPHERSDYRDLMGHQWLGFEAETIRKWSIAAGFDRLAFRPLPAPPNVKGPLLFVATGVKT
jgi:ArsR family transcriptional regulator